jgi:BirA family biotin operon repressor/biotin-[acetyl-CoA-carboxylase] ligase
LTDIICGEAIDVDRNGSLIVRDGSGALRWIESGDVGIIGDHASDV